MNSNRTKTLVVGASGLAAGAIIAGGVTLATAATGDEPSSDTSSETRGFGRGGHEHTTVTGAERTEVVDAVEAEHPDVTVVEVLQDPDGSYDVIGTQDGAPVMVEVSEDLETIELRTGGMRGPGGMGGPGGMHEHTPVTGAERTRVVDAVEAELPDVTVVTVVKDEDGSYDVMATQDGAPVLVEVSADLETVELRTDLRGPGGHGFGHHGPDGLGGLEAPESDATPSSTT